MLSGMAFPQLTYFTTNSNLPGLEACGWRVGPADFEIHFFFRFFPPFWAAPSTNDRSEIIQFFTGLALWVFCLLCLERMRTSSLFLLKSSRLANLCYFPVDTLGINPSGDRYAVAPTVPTLCTWRSHAIPVRMFPFHATMARVASTLGIYVVARLVEQTTRYALRSDHAGSPADTVLARTVPVISARCLRLWLEWMRHGF